MKRVVVLSGAGISAESGLKTFRDSDGLWENHRIEDVATPEAFSKQPELVLNFYNERRKQVKSAFPNKAHLALAELQTFFDVQIITQNIDDLHERAGSKNVLHLHGEILKSRSTINPSLIYDLNSDEINLGDLCELKSQLRPHIVWFGELVPELERAAEIVSECDIFIVVGTSLVVYPAASLVNYVPPQAKKFVVNSDSSSINLPGFHFLHQAATTGIPEIIQQLINQ